MVDNGKGSQNLPAALEVRLGKFASNPGVNYNSSSSADSRASYIFEDPRSKAGFDAIRLLEAFTQKRYL